MGHEGWIDHPWLPERSASYYRFQAGFPAQARFRRRRCACGSFSLRRLDRPPICAEGLEHRRRGCAAVRAPFRLEDVLRGEDLARAQAELAALVTLVQTGRTPESTLH
jgi:hypothetical protein